MKTTADYMKKSIDYMVQYTEWGEETPSKSLAQACLRICERDMEIDLLKQKVRHLHDATIVLRNGMGGHRHFDHTMQHGAGCEVCIEQRRAQSEADRLISLATECEHRRKMIGRPCNPMHPGDPSMCFGDETTCQCLRDKD